MTTLPVNVSTSTILSLDKQEGEALFKAFTNFIVNLNEIKIPYRVNCSYEYATKKLSVFIVGASEVSSINAINLRRFILYVEKFLPQNTWTRESNP